MSELYLASAQVLAQVLSAAAADEERPQAVLAYGVLDALANSEIPLLLVDSELDIRFHTRAAAALLQLSPRQGAPVRLTVGPATHDRTLPADIRTVLQGRHAVEREVKTADGRCYLRRIMPLRGKGRLDGTIIIFTEITDHDRIARELRIAKQQAEHASAANLRRVAAVCHDLRQPMHTIGLLGGLLAQSFKDPLGQRLAAQLDQALQAMSGMLSTLHYGSKVSAGLMRRELTEFAINDAFCQLRREFAYHAAAQRSELRIVPSRLSLKTDPALFEQMLRSLLEDVMKTCRGKIVVGCRRRRDSVRIEFWCAKAPIHLSSGAMVGDAGTVVPLGSEVAKKLADLLGCRLRCSSQYGLGPAYTVDLPGAATSAEPRDGRFRAASAAAWAGAPVVPATSDAVEQSTIFVIDDDQETCAALKEMLARPGWAVEIYPSAEAFLGTYVPRSPSCLLVDAHLTGMQGVELIEQLNARDSRPPSIVISGQGDIALAVQAMKAGALDFVEKPVIRSDLLPAIERALALSRQLYKEREERQQVLARLAQLTTRQRQVMEFMLDGKSSKAIASHLFMSQRTVESHRANVMKKMGTRSLPELARMVAVARTDLQ